MYLATLWAIFSQTHMVTLYLILTVDLNGVFNHLEISQRHGKVASQSPQEQKTRVRFPPRFLGLWVCIQMMFFHNLICIDIM
jgi:hypothetical protein